MSTKETGGPAFPNYEWSVKHGQMMPVGGMTLRDFYIAHAPTEPQPWFKPVMPPHPVAGVWEADSWYDHTSDCIVHEKRFYDNFQTALLLSGEDISLTNQAEIDVWEANAVKQRFIQWPAAWADEMLKARAL